MPATLRAFLLPFGMHFRGLGWYVAAGANNLAAEPEMVKQCFDKVFDVPWTRSPLSARNVRGYRRIREIVEEGGFDIVHVHTPIASFLTRMALRKAKERPKIIYTAHGFHFGFNSRSPFTNPYYYAERIASRWTDALVVINQQDFATAKTLKLIPDEKLCHIPGIGVDLARYSTASIGDDVRGFKRGELGLTDEDFLLLMIAEFNPGKRHKDVLSAVHKIDHRIHIAFAGGGKLFKDIEARVKREGLQKRVHILGHRQDVPQLICAADACVLPSDREGLPRSIMEAMAMGRLVIGSQIRGIEELLSDDCGLLFPVGNVDQLAEKIAQAFKDSRLRDECVANARIKIQRYGLERVMSAYESTFKNLL